MKHFNEDSGVFCWKTEYYHPNNSFTMDDYLSNHFPNEGLIHHIDGSYAEVEYEGKDFALNASGDGDSFNHKITWDIL